MYGVIRRVTADERGGGNVIFMIALAFAVLAATPFLIDLASTQYARRMAQTGSDAAALAGAKEAALMLSQVTAPVSDEGWHRSQDEAWNAAFPVAAATYFNAIYVVALNTGLPAIRDAVVQWAQANATELDEGDSFFLPAEHFTDVLGQQIYNVLVGCRVQRDVRTMMKGVYGQDYQAPGRATAETYLLSFDFARDRLLEKPVCDYSDNEGHCVHWHMEYQAWSHLITQWKIHLVQ